MEAVANRYIIKVSGEELQEHLELFTANRSNLCYGFAGSLSARADSPESAFHIQG